MSEVKEELKKMYMNCVGDRVIVRRNAIHVSGLAQHIKTEADFDKLALENKFAFAAEHPFQGTVIMVGNGKTWDGTIVDPPACKPGDIVFYGPNDGQKFLFDFGEGMMEYLVIRESNIILITGKR